MKTHIVENGVVVNTIMAGVSESETVAAYPESICLDADLHGGGIGWTWDGETLFPPVPPEPEPAPVPESISSTQGKIVLHRRGLLDRVENMVAEADREMQIAYGANTWLRTSPTLNALAQGLELSSEQLDELFIEANEMLV